jgi:hypothetical protein
MNRNFTILSLLCIVFSVAIIMGILYYSFDIRLMQQFSFLKNKIAAFKRYISSSFNWETFINRIGLPKSTLYNALDQYNKQLQLQKINTIVTHNSYGKGNFNEQIRQEVLPVIYKVLNNINTIGEQRVKFIEMDRVEQLIDSIGNIQYMVQIFVHTVDTSASSKLVLNYYKSSTGSININSLQPESKTLKATVDLKSVINTPTENIYKQFQRIGELDPIQEDINYGTPLAKIPIYEDDPLKKTRESIHEPCKYNLNSWDNRGVQDQFRLKQRCSVSNNSYQLPPPHLYKNPTMFSHAFVDPSTTYYNKNTV